MTRRAFALCLVCALVSSACLDYGDRALNFVENDANTMARALAEADLRGRWLNASKVVRLELGLRVQLWQEAFDALPAPADLGKDKIPTSAAALRTSLAALDSELSLLLRLKADAERLVEIRRAWQSVCSSRQAFDAFELGRLGWAAPIKSLTGQNPDQGVGLIIVGWDFWSAVILSAVLTATENIMRGLKSQAIEEQNAKLRTAQEKFFSVVPQPDELFTISKGVCAETQKRAHAATDAVAAMESTRGDLTAQRLLHAQNARTVLERRWIAAAKAEQSPDIVGGALVRSQASLDAGRVLNDLIFLHRRVESLTGVARLSAAELLLDAASESEVQLQTEGVRQLIPASLLKTLALRVQQEKSWAEEILKPKAP